MGDDLFPSKGTLKIEDTIIIIDFAYVSFKLISDQATMELKDKVWVSWWSADVNLSSKEALSNYS